MIRILIAAAATFAVAASAVPQAAECAEILVYNAQHASLTAAWAQGFTRDTGIKVVIRNGGDTELGNQIVQEGRASPADVFLTENSPGMALVAGAGLFALIEPEALALVPDTFRPKDGRWIGVAARSTVFAYNTIKLSAAQLPRSIMDLAEPAWKGRWAASPAGADFQAIVGAMLELKGRDATLAWLKGMKANVVPYRGNSAALKGVNAGQVDGAVIYHYYYSGDQAKTGENSNNSALHFFGNKDPGAFVSISGGGVLASSKHPADAQAFIRWIVGQGGQAVLRNGDSYEYAVSIGRESNPALRPLKDLDAPSVEPSGLNSKAVAELMTEAGLL